MNGSAFPQNDKKQLLRLVDSRFQSNNPNVSGDPVLSAPQPPVTEPCAWRCLPVEAHRLRDRQNHKTHHVRSVDCVYIIAKFPANDPLVMLQCMAENRTKLCTLLTNTMNHMNLVLGKPSCAFDQLFNTDHAGAADLVCEARMVEGFFLYCDTQKIRNVNLGGMRMDAMIWQEMQLWKRYVDNVVEARHTHFQRLTDMSVQDRANSRESQQQREPTARRVVGPGLLPLRQLPQDPARASAAGSGGPAGELERGRGGRQGRGESQRLDQFTDPRSHRHVRVPV